MNQVARTGGSSGGGLIPENMDQAVRLANAMSNAKLVPKHLQGDVGSCLMVVEQAMRWQMSPFAVASCTSVIQGRIMFEGKLVAAACEAVGAIDGHFDYTFEGEGAERRVIVSATRRGEATPRTVEVALRDAKTNNGVWVSQPDQQLVYAGSRVWARRWTPSVILGVYAPEEFGRNVNAAVDNYGGPTIEAEPVAAEPSPDHEPPRKRTWKELVAQISDAASKAADAQAVVDLGISDDVVLVYAKAGEQTRDEVGRILAEAMARVGGENADTDTAE